MQSEIAALFLDASTRQLRQALDHIEACLDRLSDQQIWSREAAHENAIGNLILHLDGNMRQWIISGVGGAPDVRDRDAEFAAIGDRTGGELLAQLRQTVNEAVAVIRNVPALRLAETITPQKHTVSVLEAIYHVTGHFQQHTGQIIFATKIMSGDLGLFRPPK